VYLVRRTLHILALIGLLLPVYSLSAQPADVVARELIVNPRPVFAVDVWVDRPDEPYLVGETVTIFFRTNQSCYVHLFNTGPSGDITVLYPNEYHRNNFIEAGGVWAFPAPGDAFEFTVGPPCGRELVKLVATSKPIDLTGGRAEKMAWAQVMKGSEMKGVKLRLDQQPTDSWAEATVEFQTAATRQEQQGLMQRIEEERTEEVHVTEDLRDAQADEDADIAPVIEQPVQQNQHALIVGISDFKDPSIPDLRFCDDDAQAFQQVCTQQLGVPPQNCRLLLNGDATQQNVVQAMQQIAQVAKPEDKVYFFFSCHGGRTPDKNDDEQDGMDEYIITHDTKRGKPDTGLLDDQFAQLMGQIQSQEVMINLDCCFAGGATKSINLDHVGMKTAGGMNGKDVFGDEYTGAKDLGQRGTVIIAASQPNEESWEDEAFQMGVFTRYFTQGLKGAADQNADRLISVKEAFAFLKDKVYDYTKKTKPQTQTPLLIDNSQSDMYFGQSR
jgi:hypothetical protein